MSEQNEYSFIEEVKEIVRQSGKSRPASSIVKNVEVAAMVSKLIRPREQPVFNITDPNTAVSAANNGMDQISKTTMSRIEDNENTFKLFPDIELAAQILISSIVSPKDMISCELIYKTNESNFPPELTAQLLDVVKKEIEGEYELKDDAPTILRDALFKTGSYIKAIIPEAAVDQLINQNRTIATESLVETKLFKDSSLNEISNIGILGDPSSKPSSGVKRLIGESILDQLHRPYQSKLYLDEKFNSDIDEYKETINIASFKQSIVDNIQITDNFQFLKMPRLLETMSQQRLSALVNDPFKKASRRIAIESFDNQQKTKITPKELGLDIYKSKSGEYTPFVPISTPDGLVRRSVGKPLVLHIPSESTIPVYIPGTPSKHVGYFIIIDADGNPVTLDSTRYTNGQGLNGMLRTDQATASMAGLLTDKARSNLSGHEVTPILDRMSEIYTDIVENDLLTRLSKGIYNKKLQLARNKEVYRIMLARALQNHFTQLIYVPSDYITYFAFDYHRNGVGKSYLDDLANITSLRAMVMFSKVMAKVKSSIATTAVHVELDPREVDPVKTIEMAKHFVARARQQYFPHGLNRVSDLTDWIQAAGIEITFSGHPKLPTTKFNFESKNIDHVEPDDTLDETFRHQTYMHFGLSPETVDSAAKADFATTIEHNSVLFSRRVMILSGIFSRHLSDFTQKVVRHDQSIHSKLIDILNSGKSALVSRMSDEEKTNFESNPIEFTNYLLDVFIESIIVDLPKPDTTHNESLKESFTTQEELVDNGLKYIFSQEILPKDLVGDVADHVDALRGAWKGYIMRKWMAESNYLPGLFDITERDEEGKPMSDLLEITKSYSEALMINITSFIKKLEVSRAAANQDLAALDVDSSGGSGGSYDSGSDAGDNDMGGGGDDFGMDLGGTEEEPTAEEPEASPEDNKAEEKPEDTKEEAAPETKDDENSTDDNIFKKVDTNV